MNYVLVTGAYGGMGSKFIKLLNDNGYKVIALDYKQGDMDGVISIKTDITSEEDVNSAYNTIKTITDNLYAIVHFAGVYMLNSLVETSASDFEKIFKINLYGAFLINKTFMPMLKKGSKILITTSELAPLDPLPFTGIYGISKTALDKYAFSLRMELQLLGVSVSVLRAGAVDTGMIDVSMTALDDFINNTKLYNCNAKRFKSIVESVEAKKIKPITLAQKALKIIEKKKPKFAYKINRNPLLILLSLMPKRFQFFIIKQILK
jgi:short-subunit dehydrogenase